jgi:RIO-like serine/threonine protein kinase
MGWKYVVTNQNPPSKITRIRRIRLNLMAQFPEKKILKQLRRPTGKVPRAIAWSRHCMQQRFGPGHIRFKSRPPLLL